MTYETDEFVPSRPLAEWRAYAMTRGQRLTVRRRVLQIGPAIASTLALGLLSLPGALTAAHGHTQHVQVTGHGPAEPTTTTAPGASSRPAPGAAPSGPPTAVRPATPGAAASGTPSARPGSPAGPTGGSALHPAAGGMVFTSDRTGAWRVYRLAPNGGAAAPLTDAKGNATDPVWSHDGTRIAYAYANGGTSTTTGSPSAISVASADGSNPIRLTTPGVSSALCGDVQNNSNNCWDSTPSWSPDGRRIAFTRSAQHIKFAGCGPAYIQCPTVWVVDLDAAGQGREHEVTTGANPTWTPDGSALIVEDMYSPSQACPECDMGHLFRVPIAGGARTDLGIIGAAPRFSHDGSRLVFWSSPATVGGNPSIVVARPDGTNGQVIGTGEMPAWTTDDTRVAVVDPSSPMSLSYIVVATQAVEPINTGRPASANDSHPDIE